MPLFKAKQLETPGIYLGQWFHFKSNTSIEIQLKIKQAESTHTHTHTRSCMHTFTHRHTHTHTFNNDYHRFLYVWWELNSSAALFRVACTPKLCMLTQLKKIKSFEPFMCLDSIMLLRLSSAVCLCSLALVQITHCLNPPFCYVMTVLFKVACMHLLPNNTCRQSDHAAQSLPGLSSQLCKKVYIINVEREKSAVSENGSAEPASCLFSKKKKQQKNNVI